MIISYVQHFASSPSTLATFAVLLALSCAVAALVRRRRLLVLATGAAFAVIGGVTLAPASGWSTFAVQKHPLAAAIRALRPQADDLWAWASADGPANVALFVPFGFLLALLLRRPSLAVVIGVLTSVAIEGYQAATGTRVGTFADVVSNSLGTWLGAAVVAVGLVVAWFVGLPARHRARQDVRPRPVAGPAYVRGTRPAPSAAWTSTSHP